MQLERNGIPNTLIVATSLCLVCSLLVSAAAIGLREQKLKNVDQFRKMNILQVAGLGDPKKIREEGGVDKVFDKYFQTLIVDLRTGEEAAAEVAQLTGMSESEVLTKFDPVKAAKAPRSSDLSKYFNKKRDDVAGIGNARENFSTVFLLKGEGGEVKRYIFPVRGRGLWSTLKGFIAVESDLQTVAGLTFYEHAETPGLGGEVENPNWKKLWEGKKIYGPEGDVQLEVVKGAASDEFGVDGLSGATITSNGVTNLLEFWLGDSGFGPYIEKQKSKQSSAVAAN